MGLVAAANDSSRFACYHLIDDYHAPSRLGTAMRVWQIAAWIHLRAALHRRADHNSIAGDVVSKSGG
jgi:hypothetical protein